MVITILVLVAAAGCIGTLHFFDKKKEIERRENTLWLEYCKKMLEAASRQEFESALGMIDTIEKWTGVEKWWEYHSGQLNAGGVFFAGTKKKIIFARAKQILEEARAQFIVGKYTETLAAASEFCGMYDKYHDEYPDLLHCLGDIKDIEERAKCQRNFQEIRVRAGQLEPRQCLKDLRNCHRTAGKLKIELPDFEAVLPLFIWDMIRHIGEELNDTLNLLPKGERKDWILEDAGKLLTEVVQNHCVSEDKTDDDIINMPSIICAEPEDENTVPG